MYNKTISCTTSINICHGNHNLEKLISVLNNAD